MRVKKDECPDFSDHDFEKILQWGNVEVKYNDKFVGSDGEVTSHPELASWVMSWGHGVISFDSLDKDEEHLARKAAALFVYLWCKGVDAMYADRCAAAYVKTWTVTKVQ